MAVGAFFSSLVAGAGLVVAAVVGLAAGGLRPGAAFLSAWMT